MDTKRSLHIALVALGLALPATAQYGLSTTVLSTTKAPKSIVLAPTPIGHYAITSLVQQSEQIPIEVTNPAAPVVGASATYSQDQFCDAVYTPAFGGRLATGLRFGGVHVWDATATNLIAGPLTSISYDNSNYSHEGLKTFSDPTGATYLLYSEQHTSPTSSGGLKVYEMNSSSLTPVGQLLWPGESGNALELSRDGRIVWQFGDRNNTATDGVLRTYSTNGYSGNPILLNTTPYPYTYGYKSKDLERNRSHNNLIGAMGWDGLVAVDITVPTNPVINTIVGPSSTIFFDGVTFVPGSDIALIWGIFRIGGNDYDFMLVADASIPGTLIPWFAVNPGFRVEDVKVGTFGSTHIYCVGRDRANSMAAIMVIF